MAIKELRLPNTGIYQRTIKSVVLNWADPESFSDFIRLRDEPSNSKANPLPSLDEIEAQAIEFLEQYMKGLGGLSDVDRKNAASAGIDYVVGQHVDRARRELEGKLRQRLSQEEMRKLIRDVIALERASDACDVLFHLQMVRSQPAGGKAEQAALDAVWLGIAFERFRVRISEPKAWTGDAFHRAASMGGAATKKDVLERYKKIASNFKASGLSQRNFARLRRVPLSALKRALRSTNKVGSRPAK